MNVDLMKVIKENLVAASELGALKALAYVKSAFETFKQYEIPLLNQSGECCGLNRPYRKEGVKEFVDFMIAYLDEAIKMIDDSDKKEGD